MPATELTFYEIEFIKLKSHFKELTENIITIPHTKEIEGKELLTEYKIPHDEILIFTDRNLTLSSPDEYSVKKAGGITINYLQNEKPNTVIFINDNVLELEAGTGEKLRWLWMHNALYHELMHAIDFKHQLNFNTKNRTINLRSAEAYADYKTLKYLHSKSTNEFMKAARNMYAQNTVSQGKKGGLRSDIYNLVTNKIGANTIEKWASKSLIK